MFLVISISQFCILIKPNEVVSSGTQVSASGLLQVFTYCIKGVNSIQFSPGNKTEKKVRAILWRGSSGIVGRKQLDCVRGLKSNW